MEIASLAIISFFLFFISLGFCSSSVCLDCFPFTTTCSWHPFCVLCDCELARQLRNRDAAVKSRERKKVYVKDLETKSRFMERECLRLGRLLQCFIAENQVLRFNLQKGSAFGASSTKQESAVLLSGLFSPSIIHLGSIFRGYGANKETNLFKANCSFSSNRKMCPLISSTSAHNIKCRSKS